MKKGELHCVILWHYFNAEGRLRNASGTEFLGTLRRLQQRLREAYDVCEKAQEAGKPYIVASQVIKLEV